MCILQLRGVKCINIATRVVLGLLGSQNLDPLKIMISYSMKCVKNRSFKLIQKYVKCRPKFFRFSRGLSFQRINEKVRF